MLQSHDFRVVLSCRQRYVVSRYYLPELGEMRDDRQRIITQQMLTILACALNTQILLIVLNALANTLCSKKKKKNKNKKKKKKKKLKWK